MMLFLNWSERYEYPLKKYISPRIEREREKPTSQSNRWIQNMKMKTPPKTETKFAHDMDPPGFVGPV